MIPWELQDPGPRVKADAVIEGDPDETDSALVLQGELPSGARIKWLP